MKLSRLFVTTSALVLAAAGIAAATLRQGPVQPDQMHAWLQSHVGTWDAKIESEMMGEATGTWEVKAGPGGLWLVSEFKSEMMGMPFHGMEFMGYDPSDATFHSYWVDSTSATCSPLAGKYDEAKKTMTLRGTIPGMDGTASEATHITTYPDADHMKFDMHGKGPDGSDMKFMTIHYTRRKK